MTVPEKSLFFSILRRLGPFNQAFVQVMVMEWLILGFQEIIRM